MLGSVALGLGVGALIGTVTLSSPILIPILIMGGVAILADSHGFFSGTATDEDVLSFSLDLALVGFGVRLTKGITMASTKILSEISKGDKIIISMHEATEEYRVLNAIQTFTNTCIDMERDMIISVELKRTIEKVTGWDVS